MEKATSCLESTNKRGEEDQSESWMDLPQVFFLAFQIKKKTQNVHVDFFIFDKILSRTGHVAVCYIISLAGARYNAWLGEMSILFIYVQCFKHSFGNCHEEI